MEDTENVLILCEHGRCTFCDLAGLYFPEQRLRRTGGKLQDPAKCRGWWSQNLVKTRFCVQAHPLYRMGIHRPQSHPFTGLPVGLVGVLWGCSEHIFPSAQPSSLHSSLDPRTHNDGHACQPPPEVTSDRCPALSYLLLPITFPGTFINLKWKILQFLHSHLLNVSRMSFCP